MLVPISCVGGIVHVDTDTLTPTAAAIARLLSEGDLHTPRTIVLESIRTVREMTPDHQLPEVTAWYGEDALDHPHQMRWPFRDLGHKGSPIGERLEAQAAALPLGYRPVGSVLDEQDDRLLVEDEQYLGRSDVLDLLRELGRPISLATLSNYASPKRAPADWPRPARYVGRTPQWNRDDIQRYAQRT